MGGKSFTSAEAQLRPDGKFGDRQLARFINCVMMDGKKSVAERMVYDALDAIQAKLAKETDPGAPKEAIEVFRMAVDNVKPFVEVRSKRIGGANYQVPMTVKPKRAQSLAYRWILEAARSEKGRPMALRLADELYNGARKEGKAMMTRDQTHRMAEANRAFAHFAN